jgi:hypothetical protein
MNAATLTNACGRMHHARVGCCSDARGKDEVLPHPMSATRPLLHPFGPPRARSSRADRTFSSRLLVSLSVWHGGRSGQACGLSVRGDRRPGQGEAHRQERRHTSDSDRSHCRFHVDVHTRPWLLLSLQFPSEADAQMFMAETYYKKTNQKDDNQYVFSPFARFCSCARTFAALRLICSRVSSCSVQSPRPAQRSSRRTLRSTSRARRRRWAVRRRRPRRPRKARRPRPRRRPPRRHRCVLHLHITCMLPLHLLMRSSCAERFTCERGC